MNGEIPSVPITTLAGIASLTDLLPELPVAGPSPSGPPCPSSNILYHATIAEEANLHLSRPTDALASQVGIALGSTQVDHIMLNAKNVAAFTHQNPPPMSVNTSHLQGALYRRDQTMFQSLNRQQQHQVQQSWNNGNNQNNSGSMDAANYSPGHNFSHNSPLQGYNQQQMTYGYNQQHQQYYQQQQQMNVGQTQHHPQQQHVQQHQSGHHSAVHGNQNSMGNVNGEMMQQNQAAVNPNMHQIQHQQQSQPVPVQAQQVQPNTQSNQSQMQQPKQEPETAVGTENTAATSVNHSSVKEEKKNNVLKPMLMLNKLTKEEEELMQKSLKSFAKENPKRAQDLGVLGGRRRILKYSDGDSSDSDSDEDAGPKKPKSKFFRATEKERDEAKAKAKEERRKRRLEEDNGDPGNVGKRRRREPTPPPEEELKPFVPKKVTKKVERKLIPMIMKIDPNELNETGTFARFNKSVDVMFDNMEDVNMQELEAASNANDGSVELPPEILIPKYQLQDLANETAKLKSMGAMESVPVDRLVKLLTVLELNIRDGSKVALIQDDDEEEEDNGKMWLEMATERVMRGAEASLTVLNIMTSKKMSKRVYIDDVIDRVALFLRFQLSNTIYPSFDPVYREISKSKTGYVGSMKKKRSYAHSVRDKNVLALYNKVTEMASMLAELVKIQLLTDTTVLHISTLGVAPFFVESIPELQLAALKLVTNVFSKYEKHRKLLLDDILASIARLPSSKRSLRTYRLNSETHIQMLTALVLQLIQCVVVLPRRIALKGEKNQPHPKEEPEEIDTSSEVDRDVLINNKYSMAMATAHQFLTVFLKKCATKNEDIDYRPLFENFVQDLLTTVNTPEWPAAELLLSLLGRVLRDKFSNKGTEMTLRLSSLEYLGVVAARLRKDAVQSKLRIDYIDSIVSAIREEEDKDGPSGESEEEDLEDEDKKKKKNSSPKKKKHKKKTVAVTDEDKENERTIFLQRVLLDYLAVNSGEVDQAIMNARHFYIGQWYRDANALGKVTRSAKTGSKAKKKRHPDDTTDEESEEEEVPEEEDLSDSAKAELYRLREERKDFLVKKILPFGMSRGNKAQVLSTHIDHDSAGLITRYLSSKRPFFNSFNQYLADILKVLCEQSTQIRTKALKCMTMIVTEDPDVLLRANMQNAVQYSLNDSSTMVREAAVDLVGRFILHKQDLVQQYYKVITDRILDTGVSVRKRVIKILKDICLEFPTYDKIPEICVKMIRRINDEEGIRKLVMDVFQNMWFVPLPRRATSEDKDLLITKARNITDVVVACRETGLEWFEQLLETLFKPKEDKDDATKKNTDASPQLVLSCQQIVDCLVESVLRMEESNADMMSSDGNGQPKGASNRLVACLTTLYLFAKIRPQLLTEHVQTLAPYLSLTARTQADHLIISNVARTLELTVPLLKHPSEIFLSQLEEASVKLIMFSGRREVEACLSCLGSVVNEVTKNFKLIRDCFQQNYKWMNKFKEVHQENANDRRLSESLPKFRRAMFTVGLLLRHFDFSKEELYSGLPHGSDTVEEVFRTMFYFMRHIRREIQLDALHAIGFVCVRHHKFMLESKLKTLYIDILLQAFYPEQHKVKVLNNIEGFLIEEEARMIRMDHQWKDYAEKENLKEMGDVSSGMASTVIQVYLKAILESFLHVKEDCRVSALKVITIILSQGLVHPAQIVPYLICMATDSVTRISHAADRDLKEIEKKYPGFIHMKLLQGIRLSFRLQQIVQCDPVVVRGYRIVKEGDLASAMNGYLYSIMKNTKAQRRAILMSLLKQFDESSKNTLSMMLYLADNLAYIPYSVLDEPLYVIHHIDIQISVSGSNLLQTFKECLKPPPSCEARFNMETGKTEYIYDEDLDDDEKSVFERLPDDPRPLQDAITAAQGCHLLLVLKEHLKDLYGLTAAKLSQYSPNDTSKAFDRQVTRRANVKFNPRQTIEILKLGEPPKVLNDEQKLDLVKKYMEFKELMNKIDPDEDEDEEGNPIAKPENRGSYRSRAQQAQQLAQQYNNNQQMVMSQMNNSAVLNQQQNYVNNLQQRPVQPLRHSSRNTPQKQQKSHNNDYYANSANMEGMVLDPETGEMVQGGGDYDEDDDSGQILNEKAPVVIKLGQLSSKNAEHSTQGSNRVPKLTIKRIDGSNGGYSGSSKKHHKKHKHKKKKKRQSSDEEDDDIVELSNDSDADYRV